MKKYLLALLFPLLFLGFGLNVSAAPPATYMRNIWPELNNTYDLGSTSFVWSNLFTNNICLGGDCRSVWPDATSTPFTNYWGINGDKLYPADLNYKVGIGTNNPTDMLTVASSSANFNVGFWESAFGELPNITPIGNTIDVLGLNIQALALDGALILRSGNLGSSQMVFADDPTGVSAVQEFNEGLSIFNQQGANNYQWNVAGSNIGENPLLDLDTVSPQFNVNVLTKFNNYLPQSSIVPVNNDDLVNLSYVSNFVSGITNYKNAEIATLVAGNLATDFENGDTIDGTTLTTGMRILIKNQTSSTENGVYTVNASGVPTRATDFDTTAKAQKGNTISITGGTTYPTGNKNTLWVQTTQDPVIGSSPLVFAQLPAFSPYTASNGVKLVGTDIQLNLATNSGLSTTTGLAVKTDNSSIEINGGSLQVKSSGITNDMLQGSIDLITKVTGTLPILNGGTGATTAVGALNNLLPSQGGNSGKVLQTDGSNASWVTPSGGGSGTNFWLDSGTNLSPVTSTRGIIISGTTTLATTTINGWLGFSKDPDFPLDMGAKTGTGGRVLLLQNTSNKAIQSGFGINMTGSPYETDFFGSAGNSNNGIINLGFVSQVSGGGVFSSKLTLNTLGKLGIGTNSPVGYLSLGNIATSSLLSYASSDQGFMNFYQSSGNSYQRYLDIVAGGSNAGGNIRILTQPANSTAVVAMFIDKNGNIGLGNNSPSTKLEINGTVSSTGIQINGNSVINGTTQFTGATNAFTNIINGATATFSGNVTTTGLRVNGNSTITGTLGLTGLLTGSNSNFSGNVGIGTTNPVNKLYVSGGTFNPASNASSSILVDGSYGGGWLMKDTNYLGFWSTDSGHTLNFSTGGTASGFGGAFGQMVLKDGKVGIGPSSPTEALDVTGNIKASSAMTASVGNLSYLYGTSWSNQAASANGSLSLINRTGYYCNQGVGGACQSLTFVSGVNNVATNTMTLYENNVGIGTTTPSYRLQIYENTTSSIFSLSNTNGTCLHNPGSGSETVTCSSDIKLKTDIKDADSNSIFNQLMGYDIKSYTIKSSGEKTIGVIAQELEKTQPDKVISDNGTKMVILPSAWELLSGIQSLYQNFQMLFAWNAGQDKEIEQLKEQNKLLLQRIEALEKK